MLKVFVIILRGHLTAKDEKEDRGVLRVAMA